MSQRHVKHKKSFYDAGSSLQFDAQIMDSNCAFFISKNCVRKSDESVDLAWCCKKEKILFLNEKVYKKKKKLDNKTTRTLTVSKD